MIILMSSGKHWTYSIEFESDLTRTLLELKEVYGKLEKAKAENDSTKSVLAKSQAEVTENELFFSNASFSIC